MKNSTNTTNPPSPPSNNTPSTPETDLEKNVLHTFSVYVQNQPGVLVRLALVFSRRGFNIESLVVSAAKNKEFSRFTITAYGDREELEQIIKQLRKLINVVKANEHFDRETIQREMALIKIAIHEKDRLPLLQIVEHFKGTTVDLTRDSIIIQITGASEKIDAMTTMLESFEIVEIIRTGKIIMTRGRTET